MKKMILAGSLAACVMAAASPAAGWEVASYAWSAVSPQLPSPEQAAALTRASGSLGWLTGSHREAAALGWIGIPARDGIATAPGQTRAEPARGAAAGER